MGRGKAWSREESKAVAKAWKDISNRTTLQKDYHTKQFAIDLYQRFLQLAPSDQDTLEKRWKSRSQMALKTHFDSIAEDVVKFNATLTKVVEQALNRSQSITETTLIRAAIAVHTAVIQANTSINFDNIYTDENDWKLFDAWKVLNTCPRYAAKALVHFRQMTLQKNDSSVPSPTQSPNQPTSTNNDKQSYLPTHNPQLQQASTPMRTLASAALSMPLLSNLASMAALANHSSPNHSNHQVDTEKRTNEENTPQPTSLEQAGSTTLGKRRANVDTYDQDVSRKEVKVSSSLEMITNGTKAVELVAQALGNFGDALSEYNALTLFSRPEMEGRQDQKIFFDALAEKHALKAKLDRDKLLQQVEQRESDPPHNNFPE